jgi:hypothetical protein
MFKIENKADLKDILESKPSSIFEIRLQNNDDVFLKHQEVILKYNLDFFKLAMLSLEDINHYQITSILIKLIPYSELNIQNIIELYRVLSLSENGTANYFSITKKVAEINYDVSKQLLKALFDINEEFTIPHIAAILSILHNNHQEEQYNTIIDFLNSADDIKIKIAISHIEQFNFLEKEFKNIFGLFKNKVKLSNIEIDKVLLYSSFYLVEKGYEYFSEIILLYIDNKNIKNKQRLAKILMFIGKSHNHTEWFRLSFLSLSDVDVEYQSITNNIQLILNALLEKSNIDLIQKFLYTWIQQSNIASKISNNSLDFFIPEFNKSIYFSRFITESLSIENNKLHTFLSSVIIEQTKLDVAVMQDYTIEDYLFICRKILGYFYQFETINLMLFSILSVKDISNEIKNIVIDILANHIGKNYPHDTLKYYNELDITSLNDNEIEATDKIIFVLEKRNEQITKLPLLKELLSPSSQNRLISWTQSITMNKIMKEAQESSLFAILCSNEVLISHGRGWFSEDYNGNISEVSNLQSFSHSVTMPNASRSHPVHFEYERLQFRMVKKGET